MPQPDSIEKVNDTVVRFKTSKFGLAVYRQRFNNGNEEKYSRPFYFGKTVKGKLTRFPLGYDMRTAEKLAEEIAAFLTLPTNTIAQAVARYNPKVAEKLNHVVSFRDVLDTYQKALSIVGRKGSPVGKKSFAGYKSFLLTMLRKVEAFRAGKPFESFNGQHGVDYSPWLDMPVSVLTTKFAMDFKMCSMPAAPEGEDEPDEDEALTAKITADTTLRSARSLFSKQAMRYYNEVGLKLPDITGFMSEPDFGAKKYFQLLPTDVIVSMMRESLSLRLADVDVYRALLLCLQCGLRRGEALAFKPSWLREEDRPMLYVTVGGTFNPKHGHGRKVAIEPWVAATLRELGPVTESAALDRLNDWSKALIPKEHAVNKAIHELRKCWVSYKAKSEGIHAAANQAGHKDVKVTTTHYADNMMSDRLIPLWKEPTEAAILKFKTA